MIRKIKTNNAKDEFPAIISWQREDSDDENTQLIYRFPKPGEKIKKAKLFNVKEHEHALFLKHGELIADLGGGTYELEKDSRIKGTEIIWFDTSMHQILWGISEKNGIPSRDGFVFGLFGDLKLHIDNVNIFYKYVVGGSNDWNLKKLKDWIKGLIHTVLRDIFKEFDIVDILRENREIIMYKVISKVCEEFNLYGLELDTFNILGFKTPENAKAILSSKQEQAYQLKNWIETEKKRDIEDRKIIQDRIASLKKRLEILQNQLLENKITREEYNEKSHIINDFILESNSELESDMRE